MKRENLVLASSVGAVEVGLGLGLGLLKEKQKSELRVSRRYIEVV